MANFMTHYLLIRRTFFSSLKTIFLLYHTIGNMRTSQKPKGWFTDLLPLR